MFDVDCDRCGKGLMEKEICVDKTGSAVVCKECCDILNQEPD